jgi:hypothetical protein
MLGNSLHGGSPRAVDSRLSSEVTKRYVAGMIDEAANSFGTPIASSTVNKKGIRS